VSRPPVISMREVGVAGAGARPGAAAPGAEAAAAGAAGVAGVVPWAIASAVWASSSPADSSGRCGNMP
jgi:hypothetical protein